MERRFRNSVVASSCWLLSTDQILAAIMEDSLLNCNKNNNKPKIKWNHCFHN